MDLVSCFDFDVDEYRLLAKKVLRKKLYDLLEKSRLIKRFEGLGLPEGETVFEHILRLVCRVEKLTIADKEKDECIKTLLVHDLPETQSLLDCGRKSDVTATEKASSNDVDEQVELEEGVVAEKILNAEELGLYQNFCLASDYLKGRGSAGDVIAVGLICKMIDKIDGNLFFHKTAAENWSKIENLSKKGQSLAFEQYVSCSKKLSQLKKGEVGRASELCQEILDGSMFTIKETWKRVPDDKVPLIIKENLGKSIKITPRRWVFGG